MDYQKKKIFFVVLIACSCIGILTGTYFLLKSRSTEGFGSFSSTLSKDRRSTESLKKGWKAIPIKENKFSSTRNVVTKVMDQRLKAKPEEKPVDRSKMSSDTFRVSDITSREIASFHERRRESPEASVDMLGLYINSDKFNKIQGEEELPQKMSLHLFDEGMRDFTFKNATFNSPQSFVWEGSDKNGSSSMHLSFYNGAFAATIYTNKGEYEIKYLSGDKPHEKYTLRKVNQAYYAVNPNDATVRGQSIKDSKDNSEDNKDKDKDKG